MTWDCKTEGHLYHNHACVYCGRDEITIQRIRKTIHLTTDTTETPVRLTLDGALSLAYRLIHAVSGNKP